MTITATADPTFRPPRNIIEVETPIDGAIMRSVSVWREDGGVRTDLRSQPVAGFETRTVYDYECPYETPVAYGWTASYVDPTGFTTTFAETWASLGAWTAVGGWSVSGGKLIYSAADSLVDHISRAVTSGKYRISLAAAPLGIASIDFGGFQIDMIRRILIMGARTMAFSPGSGAWTIDVSETAVSLTTSAGTYSVSGDAEVTKVDFIGTVATPAFLTRVVRSGSGSDTDAAGRVYIPDAGANLIRVYDASGSAVVVNGLSTAGTGNGQMTAPVDVAVAADGLTLFVAEGNRIQKFTSADGITYAYSAKTSGYGTGNGQFQTITGVDTDAAGNVYGADGFGNRIQKFNSSLVYSAQVGTAGTGNGQFLFPTGIAVDKSGSGAVYTIDGSGAFRIQKFSLALAYVTKFGTSAGTGPGQFGNPLGVDVDALGIVYVGDSAPELAGFAMRIQRFLVSGATVTYLNEISVAPGDVPPGTVSPEAVVSITVGADRRIYALTNYGNQSSYSQTATSVDDITVYGYGVPATITQTSETITLSPVEGWFIHPAQPGISFPVAFEDWEDLYTLVARIGDIENGDTSTQHEILGSEFPVVTTTGPRRADATSMELSLATLDADAALKALLRDQTPLLIQFPPSWGYGFPRAFYAVTSPRRMRELQIPNDERRTAVLELQAVSSPVVTQQNVGWSYAELALLPTYAYVKLAFASYADLAANIRNPGY